MLDGDAARTMTVGDNNGTPACAMLQVYILQLTSSQTGRQGRVGRRVATSLSIYAEHVEHRYQLTYQTARTSCER